MADKVKEPKAQGPGIAKALEGEKANMGMGVAAISEMIKESQAMRGQNLDPAASAPTLDPAIQAAADQLTANTIDATTTDALDLGKRKTFSDYLTEFKDIQRQRGEAMSGKKGIMSGLFDIAGIAAAAAGISNFSPGLTMLGSKLGQEARALEREVLDPFDKAEEAISQQIAQEIEQGDVSRFDVMASEKYTDRAKNLLIGKKHGEGLRDDEIDGILSDAKREGLPEQILVSLDSELRGMKNILTAEQQREGLAFTTAEKTAFRDTIGRAHAEFFNELGIKNLDTQGRSNEVYDRFVEWVDGAKDKDGFLLSEPNKKRVIDKFWTKKGERWVLRGEATTDPDIFPSEDTTARTDERTVVFADTFGIGDVDFSAEVVDMGDLFLKYPLFQDFGTGILFPEDKMPVGRALNLLIKSITDKSIWREGADGQELWIPTIRKSTPSRGGKHVETGGKITKYVKLFEGSFSKFTADDAQKQALWDKFVESGGKNMTKEARVFIEGVIDEVFEAQGAGE